MFALSDCQIFDGQQRRQDMALLISEGKITALLPDRQLPLSLPRYPLGGALVSAGFIDLQLNGCGGVMFNTDISQTTLAKMQCTNLASGTTSFLPTLITSCDHDIKQAINAVSAYMAEYQYQVLGLHLEGPYINVERKGIHPAPHIRPLDKSMLALLCQHAAVIAKVTIAPECHSAAQIQQLANAGILVALGHTAASYEQAMAGIKAGIGFATHLYNAMSPTSNGRTPGVVGAVYDSPALYAGIIVDGIHVHPANIRLAHQVMKDKLCLVTDGTAAAGAPPELSEFDFCGTKVFIRDGQCVDEQGTLGGSSLTMIEGVRNLVSLAGLPLEEALRMASLYPARALGMSDVLGSIAPGKVANLVILNNQLEVCNTLVQGQVSRPLMPA